MDENIYSDLSQKNLKNRRFYKAVSVAAELFLERGIEDVKMTDIAEACDVGVATLYRYFGTKQGIVIEVMTFLWEDIRHLFSGVFDSERFLAQSGIKQLSDLMRMFLVLYDAHGDFVKLVGEFDRFVIRENVQRESLWKYERSVVDFYPVLLRAYNKGCEDGTVRQDIDFRLFYMTFAHALTEMCKKFIGGKVLPSDDPNSAKSELQMLIDAAVFYIAK